LNTFIVITHELANLKQEGYIPPDEIKRNPLI